MPLIVDGLLRCNFLSAAQADKIEHWNAMIPAFLAFYLLESATTPAISDM